MANVAVIVCVPPAGSEHPGATVQGPLELTSVSPAGAGSATSTLAASDGPRLVTPMVKTAVPPRDTVPGPVLVIATSARVTTGAVTVAVLLAVLKSGTAADAVTAADVL